jgi:hypothetical protein
VIEELPGAKHQVPMTKSLKEKWKGKKPSQDERDAYIHPQKHPLTPTSTIIDAIIHFSAARPIKVDRGRGSELPIDTRYPFILEEVSRLASKEAMVLLHNKSTQDLRQRLSQVIESFGSSPGFSWKWHDEFKSSGSDKGQLVEEDEGAVSESEEVGVLLTDILKLDRVQELLNGATPSIQSQVSNTFEAAIKVISCCGSAIIN